MDQITESTLNIVPHYTAEESPRHITYDVRQENKRINVGFLTTVISDTETIYAVGPTTDDLFPMRGKQGVLELTVDLPLDAVNTEEERVEVAKLMAKTILALPSSPAE